MAVAEASFKILKLSISFGFTSDNGLATPAGLSFPIGTPSITIKGLFCAFNDDPPRILIFGAESGDPPAVVILTPAALPFNNWSVEIIAPLLKSFVVITSTDPVASSFLTLP